MRAVTRPNTLSMLISFGLFVAACGSSDSDAPAVVEYEDLRAAEFQARCQKAAECNPLSPPGTSQRCALELEAASPRDPALDAIVAEGSAVYDADRGGACVATVLGQSCEEFQYGVAVSECANVFTGTVAIGGECFASEQCAGDAFCDTSAACPGVCAARKAVGETCTLSKECVRSPNAGCYGNVCKEIIVRPLVAADGGCGFRDDVASVTITPCEPGLSCVRDIGNPFVGFCKNPIAIGGACTSRLDACVPGAACREDEIGLLSCVEIIVVTEGEECDAIENPRGTRLCDTTRGLFCSDGTCSRAGTGEEETACLPTLYDGSTCDEGLYCASGANVCAAKRPDDAECANDAECESGACAKASASGALGVCAARRCE
jgi:hypothetical protein